MAPELCLHTWDKVESMDVFAILWLCGWNIGLGSITWHQWRIWKKYVPAESRVDAHGHTRGNGELTLTLLSGDFGGRISRLELAESDALQNYPLGSILNVSVDRHSPGEANCREPRGTS